MATQYYEALSQSQLKITKEVTINTAIDFTNAGCPRLGTIACSYQFSSDVSTDIKWVTSREKRVQLTPIYPYSTCYFGNQSKKNSSYLTSNKTLDGLSIYECNHSSGELGGGVVVGVSGGSTIYHRPQEISSVELDGKTYYGYKSAYYCAYTSSINGSGSECLRVGFKGKVTAVVYRASSQTIDTIEKTFGGSFPIADGYLCIYYSSSASAYAFPCLVIPKEDDDLVLGIFVEDVE